MDPRTRTVGVIVSVDDPYGQAESGRRPPLVKNMYVEVEIRGRPRPTAVVIPRAALHGNRVHTVGSDNRLNIREIEVDFVQADFVVVGSGLAAGERVVISDLPFAVEGMRLVPDEDDAALEALLSEALGTTPVQ